VTDPAAPVDRLYAGQVVYWRRLLVGVFLIGIGAVFFVVGLLALVLTARRTTLGVVADVVIMAVGVAQLVILSPYGRRALTALDRQGGPFLEADATAIRLVRPSEPPQRVDRSQVVRATHVYRASGQASPSSVLQLYAADDRKVATWNLYPLLGRAVARWLRRLDIDTTVRHRPT
jgi:hypothetical protein